jgi:SAM-dependent methyltransferase
MSSRRKHIDGFECPLCSSSAGTQLSEHGGKRLVRCLHCDIAFVHPMPSRAAIAAHFLDTVLQSEADLESRFIQNRALVLGRVASYIQTQKREGSILDVGGATGFFLSRFFSHQKWQTFEVELSSQKADKAASAGIVVYRQDLCSANLPQGFFDVVSVLDTFCYFAEPQVELAEFHRVLKSEGLLILELPLAGSRIWRASGCLGRFLSGTSPHLLQSSDHLYYYSPKSVTFLLERHGFRVHAILPLPGNRQGSAFRNLMYRVYSLGSQALYFASRSRILLGPRFLVGATKARVNSGS